MNYEVLTTDDDLLEYSEQTLLLINVSLPLEYLKRSKVVAFRDRSGNIAAGYCMALKPPFRALVPVPEEIQAMLGSSLNKIIEVNGLWIDARHRGGVFAIKFWLALLIDFVRSKRRFFLYSYSSHKVALARFYAKSNPTRIWSGDVCIEGMDKHDHESVEIVHMRNVMIWMVKNFYSKVNVGWHSLLILRSLKTKRTNPA